MVMVFLEMLRFWMPVQPLLLPQTQMPNAVLPVVVIWLSKILVLFACTMIEILVLPFCPSAVAVSVFRFRSMTSFAVTLKANVPAAGWMMVAAPAPVMLTPLLTVTDSAYVPAARMMVSPSFAWLRAYVTVCQGLAEVPLPMVLLPPGAT